MRLLLRYTCVAMEVPLFILEREAQKLLCNLRLAKSGISVIIPLDFPQCGFMMVPNDFCIEEKAVVLQ